jgi:hypothetical protein
MRSLVAMPIVMGLALLVSAASPAPVAVADSIVLVVNPSAGLTRVGRRQAKRFPSGRDAKWPNGQAIVLIMPPNGSAALTWLADDVMGMPVNVYRRFLLAQVFKGVLRQPIETSSIAELQRALILREGAVSALPRSAVPSTLTILELE